MAAAAPRDHAGADRPSDISDDLRPPESPDELADPPECLKHWIHGKLRHLDRFSQQEHVDSPDPGPKLRWDSAHFFAGADPSTSSFVIAGDDANVDALEDFLQGEGFYDPAMNLSIETNAATGGWELTSFSGEKARIVKKKDDAETLLFEIEPTMGASNYEMDLRYTLDAATDAGKLIGRLRSTIHLYIDQPLKAGAIQTGGEETPVEMTPRWREISQ